MTRPPTRALSRGVHGVVSVLSWVEGPWWPRAPHPRPLVGPRLVGRWAVHGPLVGGGPGGLALGGHGLGLLGVVARVHGAVVREVRGVGLQDR